MDTARARGREASGWLALGPASRILGVDPDTLRRWSDSGAIRSFTTPGGHRRFDRADLERLTEARHSGRRRKSPSSLGLTEERLEAAYRRRFETATPAPRSWLDLLDEQDRLAFRRRGRSLQGRLLAHLDGGASREALLEAEQIGREYGGAAARLGLSLAETIPVFLLSRGPFLSELAASARRRHLAGPEAADLLQAAGQALDRVLLAVVAAHESPDPSPPTRRGDADGAEPTGHAASH